MKEFRPKAASLSQRQRSSLQTRPKARRVHWLSMFSLVALASCSAFPNQNLRNNYVKAVDSQGLTAVYPPREEFQVGDVFIRSYDEKNLVDLDSRAVVWLGTLTSLQKQADLYMNSRINFEDTVLSGTGNDAEAKLDQPDFSSNNIPTNNTARRTLPIVAFPVVTGAATTAGSLGGAGFVTSFGLGLGTTEKVSLDFTDTRVHGVPFGAATTAGAFEGEYLKKICGIVPDGRTQLKVGFERLELAAERLDGIDKSNMCKGDRTCDVAVITRTYVTRKLKFNYTSARITRLAAAQRLSPLPEAPTTVAVPGNVDVTVTLGPDDDGKQVDALLSGISNSVANTGGQNSESAGLSFLGFQGNTLGFQRTFLKPLAIAYNSVNFPLDGRQEVCWFTAPDTEN